jgi:transposase
MPLKEISLSDLEKKYKKEKDRKIKQRLHILLLLREGWTQREAAKMLHISNGIVPFWKARFESGGFDSLQDKEGRGIKSKLDEEELSMLGSVIEEGVLMEDGYRRGYKTKDVIGFIYSNFGIEYTARHCRRILQSFDCSLQVPRPRNKSRNQEDVDKFKREFKKNEKIWVMT